MVRENDFRRVNNRIVATLHHDREFGMVKRYHRHGNDRR
jgi:hypothetical protein